MNGTGAQKTLLLIDGHALAFRMFFALERTNMQTTEHTPTWAVYGFFKAIFDLLKQNNGLGNIKPDSIAVAFDVSRKTFRLEKYEGYKANRETMPDSLRPQFGLIMEGLNALNIPIYTKEGFEGDDIIGTIATHAADNGYQVSIMTGDKDMMQLVDEHIFVYKRNTKTNNNSIRKPRRNPRFNKHSNRKNNNILSRRISR